MKNMKIFLLIMGILPWLSIPLLGNRAFKRFLPASLFMCLYLILEGWVAQKRKWWWFSTSLKPNVLGEMPLIFGPFIVGSLWILKFTYGKFKLYLLVNLIIDSIFTYGMLGWFKKIGYVSLVRMSKLQLSLIFMVKSIIMYGFQMLFEKIFPRRSEYWC